MKRLIPFLLIIFCANTIFAQDIIVTKKSEKIEARITDVEQDCIKYKKFNYQEGPTYTIKKSEIASVIYQNGDVETFSEEQISASTSALKSSNGFVKGQCSHISISSNSLFGFLYGGDKSKVHGFVLGEPVAGLSDSEIENKIRTGELMFYEDRDFKDYLEENDREAYYKLKQGLALQVSGYVCIVTGSAVCLSFLLTNLLANDRGFSTTVALPAAGAGLLFAAAVGLPMYFSGRSIANKKVPALYNSHINRGYTSSLSWNFGVVDNGVGLRLNF